MQPTDLVQIKKAADDFRSKIKPDLSQSEIASLMQAALNKTFELNWLIYRARAEEGEKAMQAKYVAGNAFRLSEASSDKKREADVETDKDVKYARLAALTVKTQREFLEDMHSAYLAQHHALKAMLKSNTQESWTQ